jgi:hypothetical protein
MENCYEGITTPEPIAPPCGGEYLSTDCIITPSSIPYIEIVSGASQTEINSNLVLALQSANSQIQDLLNRVDALENA